MNIEVFSGGWQISIRSIIFTLLVSILLNLNAELMHAIVTCWWGTFEFLNDSNLFWWNEYFFLLVETSFLIHMTVQQNKLNIWQRNEQCKLRQNIKLFGLKYFSIDKMRMKCLLHLLLSMEVLVQFVLSATFAVAKLHIHYVEYSDMCNCAWWEVQTGVSISMLGGQIINSLSGDNFSLSRWRSDVFYWVIFYQNILNFIKCATYIQMSLRQKFGSPISKIKSRLRINFNFTGEWKWL